MRLEQFLRWTMELTLVIAGFLAPIIGSDFEDALRATPPPDLVNGPARP